MIKIISGYSHAAGSTLALVNLCNQFASRGYACVFYGPDNWHIDKCSSGNLAEFSPQPGDTIIANNLPLLAPGDLSDINALMVKNRDRHYLKTFGETLKKLLPAKISTNYKLCLTCLNKDALPLSSVRLALFEKIHFACGSLQGNVSRPSFIAPAFCNDLNFSGQKPKKLAGVIGSIKSGNHIEKAIEQALLDGMETVTLFGYMKEPHYFYEKILPLTIKHPGRIKYAGFEDNRQKMYDAVSDVYSSVSKPWSLVGQECSMTGTRLHAPETVRADCRMANDQIFELWKNELAL